MTLHLLYPLYLKSNVHRCEHFCIYFSLTSYITETWNTWESLQQQNCDQLKNGKICVPWPNLRCLPNVEHHRLLKSKKYLVNLGLIYSWQFPWYHWRFPWFANMLTHIKKTHASLSSYSFIHLLENEWESTNKLIPLTRHVTYCNMRIQSLT